MKYKLLALDMDGTTLQSNGMPSENTINSINKYISKGGNAAIISGRNSAMLVDCIKSLNLTDSWHVGLNGMILFNKDKIIPLVTMEQSMYKKLLKIIRDRENVSFLVFTHESVYYEYAPKILDVKQLMGIEGCIEEKRLDDIIGVTKFVVYYNSKEDDAYWRNICREYDMEGVLSAKNWFEIFPKGVSKFSGIEKLCELLNIKNDEIAAVGDQENDIDMIKNAGFGVAVKNAVAKVKEAADLVLDKTNDEDAVSFLIEEYLLK